MEASVWVPLAVALVSGGGLVKGLEIWNEWRTNRAQNRRSEVDYMAGLLAEEKARARVSERRARIAVELMHEYRVIAISLGAKSSELPPVDFRDG